MNGPPREPRMSHVTHNELQQFTLFLTEKVRAGESRISPEEALDEWRAQNPAEDEFAESVADLREALEEDEREPGISLEELDREIRAEFGWTEK